MRKDSALEKEEKNIQEESIEKVDKPEAKPNLLVLLIPLFVAAWMFIGFSQITSTEKDNDKYTGINSLINDKTKSPGIDILALITGEQFSSELRDTVYTDRDKWLELRIDQQTVYVHYRDGRIKHYPVSSGNKFLSKGIESRPGLFAIFLKEELHLSSQFDDAKMFNYMPFNMGIGFHSLAGTGYYGSLGVRPASHGCIRMRHEDAKALFDECPLGTLVLAHRGKTARVVAFAPLGFKNEKEYTKEDYQSLLAYNLNSVYEGKYFMEPPRRFVIDPAVIPRIGYYVGDADDIPEKQQVPVMLNVTDLKSDRLDPSRTVNSDIKEKLDKDISEYFGISEEEPQDVSDITVTPELIKKLVYNLGGILPYFPPNKDK
jgi:hypothetical protein